MPVSTALRRTAAVVVAAAAIAAIAAVVPVLGMSVARADSPPAGTGGDGLAKACDRLPHRVERLEKIRARFHAGARTRGSLAFLEARIAAADADGHPDLARLLRDRLAVREDLDSVLPDVLARLHDAQRVCRQHPAAP